MFNKVILIGRLTKDPEVKVTTSGITVGTFSLAVNRNFTNQNGERETDFFNCVCYRKLAETVGRYVKKGHQINVEGRIQNRTYEQDGVKRYITEIIVENVVFLESKSQQSNDYNNNQYQNAQPTFNIPQQQNRNYNQMNNQNASNTNQQPQYKEQQDNYFEDNNNVDISEDDLPF